MGSSKTTFMTICISFYRLSIRIGMIFDILEAFTLIPHPYKFTKIKSQHEDFAEVIAHALSENYDIVIVGEKLCRCLC